MPDICMCANETCRIKKLCYRHEAAPTPHRQSYTHFTHEESNNDKINCKYFMQIKK